jgi:hypothetical protein
VAVELQVGAYRGRGKRGCGRACCIAAEACPRWVWDCGPPHLGRVFPIATSPATHPVPCVLPLQEHVWNVIPSFIYIFAAGASVWLQLNPLPPPFVSPLPALNDTLWVPGATCYPNVPYDVDVPPCGNPRVFNAPCPLYGKDAFSVCWEEQVG